jgi:crotonobetainyl-CoA:carnitine CoA-transferase CaiB-like acyl-CoA transferase
VRGLSDEACRPLRGLRVPELAQVMDGPVTGLMLAVPPGFQILNRGKKSLALDLKHPDGRAVLERLVRDADVLTENFRPGTIEKLGADTTRVLRENGFSEAEINRLVGIGAVHQS